MPPALLEEVFALNEELDEVRELRAGGAPAERMARAARSARASRSTTSARSTKQQLQALSARWDALWAPAAESDRRAVLDALRERMLERNYISNLLAGIERELNQ